MRCEQFVGFHRLKAYLKELHDTLADMVRRLESRQREVELMKRGMSPGNVLSGLEIDEDYLEDLEDGPKAEIEEAEDEILDQATASQTIEELRKEIETLRRLEALARTVRSSGQDTKWMELAGLLHEVFHPNASRELGKFVGDSEASPVPSKSQKLVVFTEHKDTLSYLRERITTLPGSEEAVVTIHGAVAVALDQLQVREYLVAAAYVRPLREHLATSIARAQDVPHGMTVALLPLHRPRSDSKEDSSPTRSEDRSTS